MPSAEFTKAFNEVTKLKAKPSQDEQLKLYGLAKIAKGEEVKKPGTFDFTGKAKFGAWEKLKNEGITADQADGQYVKLVEELKAKHGVEA